jgi:hypothetical protein
MITKICQEPAYYREAERAASVVDRSAAAGGLPCPALVASLPPPVFSMNLAPALQDPFSALLVEQTNVTLPVEVNNHTAAALHRYHGCIFFIDALVSYAIAATEEGLSVKSGFCTSPIHRTIVQRGPIISPVPPGAVLRSPAQARPECRAWTRWQPRQDGSWRGLQAQSR